MGSTEEREGFGSCAEAEKKKGTAEWMRSTTTCERGVK